MLSFKKFTPVFMATAMLVSGCATTGSATDATTEMGIVKPLTDKPGDPVNGKKLVMARDKGNCIACHWLPEATFPGNAGPNLYEAIRNNERSVGWIRQKIVNPKVDNPDTLMFTFYDNTGKHNLRKDWRGKRVLEAQEVEDVIAFLLTLRK
ncbi:monoheme cytochrome SoxX (sulfur oxidation) [Magnetococcus marinus MC-1]|uniref:Monoheme cytochrome SoxX (Sulfur oxidation) n=1 Tax=Magnetococcus marinus (strain ATCC BAA-1437 / JCM 17883 / MC-1) TaxID=156889 RepID=A0L8X4_MAGMM|nr:sulfur oxidation c-type cytochrome SoxX [Magnetococcus marinus]ABK44417.1 monoheme cytochrome SoxX (sulfur oxidation) [Magnetococcus marinus MC-1]